MRVALLGLGEAGQVFAEGFRAAGREVVAFDPAPTATPDGVRRAKTGAEAVREADFVISLATARHAVTAAVECRDALPSHALYLDLNAASPTVKEQVAEELGDSVRFVDGAVIGSVRQFGPGVEVLLSGAGSEQAAECLREIGTRTEVLDGPVGMASRRKLLRSIFMKGLGALVDEAVAAGAAADDEVWLREQIAKELAGGHEIVERLHSGTKIHALRRSRELADSLDQIRQYADIWPVTTGAYERHLRLAREQESERALFEALAAVPTAALGDGYDRLGFADARIRPVWDAGPLVGRAFTISTRAGDNLAIHEALAQTHPGDVLVIATEGSCDRALLGDLIAERAVKAGVAGIILDGAVRDVEGIREAGLPVWAAGVSAAGPYKHGPFRLRVPIALGGAVCHDGDIVVADAEGVYFVAPENVEATLRQGQAVLESESSRREAIRRAY